MRIHEAGKDNPSPPIDRDSAWIRFGNVRISAACDHAALVYQKPAVFMAYQRVAIAQRKLKRIVRRVEDGCAEEVHYFKAGRRT